MGYHIHLQLQGVRLRETQAWDGLHRILDALLQDPEVLPCGAEQLRELWAQAFASVAAGAATAVDLLGRVFTEQGFDWRREGGCIALDAWGDGYGPAAQERIVLEALADLFEAGGMAWGSGQDGERWQYRFLGGRHEFGMAPDGCWVSREDRSRVAAAWLKAECVLPPDVRLVLRDALCRAEFLIQTKPQAMAS